MKNLKGNDNVYIDRFGSFHLFTVGTIETFYSDNHLRKTTTVQEGIERAIERGDDLAWSMKHSCVLTSDKSYYVRQDLIRAAAICLTEGEEVEIESRIYTVTVVRGDIRYSDAIKFIPKVDPRAL